MMSDLYITIMWLVLFNKGIKAVLVVYCFVSRQKLIILCFVYFVNILCFVTLCKGGTKENLTTGFQG